MNRVAYALGLSGVLLLATWVQAPASPTSEVMPPSAAAVAALDQAVSASSQVARDIDQEAERLRQRLSQEIPAPAPSRDPFRFRVAEPPAPAKTSAKVPSPEKLPAPSPNAAPPAPVVLMPTLIGITEETANGVVTRSAVLSMGDDMAIVKAGQTFARFIVQTIGPSSVEIVDATNPARSISVLTLR